MAKRQLFLLEKKYDVFYAKTLVSSRCVSYRSMGFGEKAELPRKEFTLELELKELPASFIKKAESFIVQCKKDDEDQGFSDIQEIYDLNYKPFTRLIKEDAEVASFLLKEFLYIDLLDELFKSTKNPKIIINRITSISIDSRKLSLFGEAFESKTHLIQRLRKQKNKSMKNNACALYKHIARFLPK